MPLRFGTDGVRGPADQLDDRFVVALGRAAASVLGPGPGGDPTFLIGRDPRSSGARIEAALARGLEQGGAVARSAGVVPTPVVAWLSSNLGVPAAMISASHNPATDNGIKVFAAGGRKLADEVEEALEAGLDELLAGPDEISGSAHGGAVEQLDPSSSLGYEDALAGSIGGRTLAGLDVVIDCANGAASTLGPEVLRRLGATVRAINASPDGSNINDACGSTHPEELQAAVAGSGATVGLAFDGDADRVLAVDEAGELVDGDHLIALCAADLQSRGQLAGDAVVVTVMSNLGLRLAMARRGIEVVETPVGDRHVLEALDEGGWSLGGEQSGHIIFRELATTGDGLLTGVQLLDLLARAGRPLSELAAEAMTTVPQVLRNVVVGRRPDDLPPELVDEVEESQRQLGDGGRVLVRSSGTEPLVRVMVEALDPGVAAATAERLVAAVERTLGDPVEPPRGTSA